MTSPKISTERATEERSEAPAIGHFLTNDADAIPPVVENVHDIHFHPQFFHNAMPLNPAPSTGSRAVRFLSTAFVSALYRTATFHVMGIVDKFF